MKMRPSLRRDTASPDRTTSPSSPAGSSEVNTTRGTPPEKKSSMSVPREFTRTKRSPESAASTCAYYREPSAPVKRTPECGRTTSQSPLPSCATYVS